MSKSLFFAVIAMTLWGCSAVKQPAGSVPAAVSRSDAMVQAIIDSDYQKFADAAQELPELPEKEENEFRNSCKQLTEKFGTPNSFRYLGELKTPLLINRLYAVGFVRRNSDGKAVEHEQLFQIVFAGENNKFKLLGMRFL